MIALDTSALLAFMFRERGHELVAPHLDDCCMSAVNLSEVIGRFTRDGHDPRVVAKHLHETAIEFVQFTSTDAQLCASLLPQTYKRGLSLADRACLALALQRKIPVLTADKEWLRLELGIPIQLVR